MLEKTEEEIMANWTAGKKPLVSICCLAYKHEPFIAQTIEGFLIQETNFPFEIIIGEDRSPDNTMDVIKKYQDKYPNLIKIVTSENNVGMHENFIRTHEACKAPYIAYCEGDDYWTDPKKLAIQISFLEENPNYVLSGHDAVIHDEDGNLIHHSKLSRMFGKDVYKNPHVQEAWTLTMTAVYRNVIKEWPEEMRKVINLDLFIQTLLLQHGKRKFHDNIEKGVYRMHSGGVWSLLEEKKQIQSNIDAHIQMIKYFERTGQREEAEKMQRKLSKLKRYSLKKRIPFRKEIKKTLETLGLRKPV